MRQEKQEMNAQNPWKTVCVHFENRKDMEEFSKLVGQAITLDTRSIWYADTEDIKHSGATQTQRDLTCPECNGTLFVYSPENGQSTCQSCGFNIPVGRPEPEKMSEKV